MLSRHELASFTERLLEHLDLIDGDPDYEEADPSGHCDEDGISTGRSAFFQAGWNYNGAGRPLSDPGEIA